VAVEREDRRVERIWGSDFLLSLYLLVLRPRFFFFFFFFFFFLPECETHRIVGTVSLPKLKTIRFLICYIYKNSLIYYF
jgi:hypothetical protein